MGRRKIHWGSFTNEPSAVEAVHAWHRRARYGLCMAFIACRKPALAVVDAHWPDEHYYIIYFVSVNKIEKKTYKERSPSCEGSHHHHGRSLNA